MTKVMKIKKTFQNSYKVSPKKTDDVLSTMKIKTSTKIPNSLLISMQNIKKRKN